MLFFSYLNLYIYILYITINHLNSPYKVQTTRKGDNICEGVGSVRKAQKFNFDILFYNFFLFLILPCMAKN